MSSEARRKSHSSRRIISQVRKLMEEKGRNALELARRLMLENEENIECAEVRDALRYFANKYWSDLARPTLMSLSCEAVGGDCQKVTSITVPIMLFTGGMDLHDDVIDQSTTKNGRSTVYGKFGKDIALLAGDALILKGFTRLFYALRQVEAEKAARVLGIIEDMFFELGDAEALELRLKAKIDVDPGEYLRIVRRKAADVEAYTYISALLSEGTEEEIEALQKYGRISGMLAIIRDDLIDIVDEEELIHRLRFEVAPLPMLYATQKAKARTAINSILCKKRITKKDANTIIQIIRKNEGITKTREKIDELMKEGLSNIQTIKHNKEKLKLLIDIMKTT